MKALFVSVLLLGLFTATLASRRDRRGHRRTQDTVYSLQRYVFSLKKCLRDVRAENNQLTTTNNRLKEDNKELEVVKAENKELEEKVQKLEEDIEALEECCKYILPYQENTSMGSFPPFILYFTVKTNVYQNLIKLVFSLI